MSNSTDDGTGSPPKKKCRDDDPMSSDSSVSQKKNSGGEGPHIGITEIFPKSSGPTTPQMFCCGKHPERTSDSRTDPSLFEKASTALIELLLKIQVVDKGNASSASGNTDFTVLDHADCMHSPLKAFFLANFSTEERDLVDHMSSLAIQKSISDLMESRTKLSFEEAIEANQKQGSASVSEKLSCLLDLEIKKAKERADETTFALETCRRTLENLIADGNEQEWKSTLDTTLKDSEKNRTCKPACAVSTWMNKSTATPSGPKSEGISTVKTKYEPTSRTQKTWLELNKNKPTSDDYKRLQALHGVKDKPDNTTPDKQIEVISEAAFYAAQEQVCGVCNTIQEEMVRSPTEENPALAIAFCFNQQVSVQSHDDVCKCCVDLARTWLKEQVNENKDKLLFDYVDAQKSKHFVLIKQIKGNVRVIPRDLPDGQDKFDTYSEFRDLVRLFISHTLATYGVCDIKTVFEACQNYIPPSYSLRHRSELNSFFENYALEFSDVSIIVPCKRPKKAGGKGKKSKSSKDFHQASFVYYGPTSAGRSSKFT